MVRIARIRIPCRPLIFDLWEKIEENGQLIDTVATFFFGKIRGWKLAGTHLKNLRIFLDFGFNRSTRQLRRTSEGAGASRRLFDGADTTGEIRFTAVRPQRKQKRPN